MLCIQLKYKVLSVPTTGKLHQLSQVFSAYGYDPKAGTQITNSSTAIVTGSNNRLYYARPNPDAATNKKVWFAVINISKFNFKYV